MFVFHSVFSVVLVSQGIKSTKTPDNENYFLAYRDYASQLAGISENHPKVTLALTLTLTLTHVPHPIP
jgi:hypothetical protein